MLSFYLSLVETEAEQDFVTELYNTYEQDMYGIAYSILHNKFDAEDAVSEAFVKIINNLTKVFEISADERGYYIVIIVKNVSIDMYNKKRKKNEVNIEDCTDFQDDLSIENEAISKMEYERISAAIATLSDNDYSVLYLYLMCEMSPSEIADILNVKPNVARQRIYKAKKNLMKILKTEGYEHADS